MKINFVIKSVFAVALTFVATQMICAQDVQLLGVKNSMRYDDGDDTKYEYLGWNYETQKAEFKGDVGLWTLDTDGKSSVKSNLVHYDNLMYGNSGSIYMNGVIYTVMSHEDPDAESSDVYEFVVRKWDAQTYALLSTQRYPKSSNIESRGMAYNPKDGKVYGLFYLTDVVIDVEGYEPDQDDIDAGQTTDAGYAICSIDLETMKITQITPGVYYDNFVTLACSPEGRLFSMTSSGTLVEFDAKSGLMVTRTFENEEGDEEVLPAFGPSGVVSQFKRQAACFDYHTGKMYWNGYVNSGKGYNDWGSYGPLSDKEWRTNGKYDTALYEVSTETGAATKIANIPNRIAFSCLWVKGADASDIVPPGSVSGMKGLQYSGGNATRIYTAGGQLVTTDAEHLTPGLYIIKKGNITTKVLKK